jgi:hypothetical protein
MITAKSSANGAASLFVPFCKSLSFLREISPVREIAAHNDPKFIIALVVALYG